MKKTTITALIQATYMKLVYTIILLGGITFTTQGQVSSSSSFRSGNAKNGIYKGKDFNTITELLWRYKTKGAVRSTPTLSNGKLYIGSSEGIVYCLNANNGSKIWGFQAPQAVHSTIAIANGKVFFTDKKNNLYALDASNGKNIWQTDLNPDLPYEWGFDYYQSSPVVLKGTVYIGSGDGKVYAINESDGKTKWSFKAASLVRSSPTLTDGLLFFGDLSGKVYAIDAYSGQSKWMFATRGDTVVNEKYGNDYKAIIASVAVENNVAVIGGRDGYLYGLDARTGKELWNYSYDGSWVISSVAIKNNVVITGTSDERWIHAFDLLTGKEKWKYRSGSSVWASPIIVESTVLAAVNDGFFYGLDFETGKEKFRYRFGERALSSPIYDNGTIYIGNDDGFISAFLAGTKATSGRPIKKAVFYISDVMGKYIRPGMNTLVRDYFVGEGYELLSEEKLAAFLTSNSNSEIASVVVFAAGYFPPEILNGGYHKSILYNYLSRGGKIVVLGVNPALHQFDYNKKEYKGLNYSKCDTIIGVSYKYNDLRSHYGFYSSTVTETGKKWGLTQTIPAYAAVDVTQVTPLAIDENGKATYWIKNYGHKEGTGFVQLWLSPTTLHHLGEVKQISEFGVD